MNNLNNRDFKLLKKRTFKFETAEQGMNQKAINNVNKIAFESNVIDAFKKKQIINLIDIDKEWNTFLLNKSKHTQQVYQVAINQLCTYFKDRSLLTLKRSDAEMFLHYLTNQLKLVANSIRLKIKAIQSFYEYLGLSNNNINNPFKNIKLPRAFKKHENTVIFLDSDDINQILGTTKEIDPIIYKAVWLAVKHGLRGAECGLIKGNKYELEWVAKGNKKRTIKPTDDDIKLFELTDKNKKVLIPNFNYQYRRLLFKAIIKKLNLKYEPTPHDFRHYFAINHYKQHKDVGALKDALGHSNIATTDTYLQSLKVKSEPTDEAILNRTQELIAINQSLLNKIKYLEKQLNLKGDS